MYLHLYPLESRIKSNPFPPFSQLPPNKHTIPRPSLLHFASTEINFTANTFLLPVNAMQLACRREQDLVYFDNRYGFQFLFFRLCSSVYL